MINTKVKINGIEFKNPIIAASGTYGFGKEYGELYDIGILGGIALKGLTLHRREGNDVPRIAETPSGILNSVGLQNPGVEHFLKHDLPALRKIDTVLIANIAGADESDYIKMAEHISDSSVDIIELNISCPNVKEGGIAFGVKPKSVESITRLVKKHCLKPLMVKLSPNVASIRDCALAACAGGADSLSLINTVTGMAVDIRAKKPVLKSVFGGLSGPAIKPIALKMVYDVCGAVDVPVVGIGGIATAEDVVEFLMCGAAAVQVGTANMSDPYACRDIIAGLEQYMRDNKIKDVNEIRGVILSC
jgi:dihydroorotate dehydrogenase (NAD+) catalytic subunit